VKRRDALEPHQPRTFDLSGDLDGDRFGGENVGGPVNQQHVVCDPGEVLIVHPAVAIRQMATMTVADDISVPFIIIASIQDYYP